ncbi:hypothetical protein L9F63_017860 [Diploptera punctata]|uniref:Protein TsetseEP domain-containing protein n=1 Tax=Diploptera punctata TaxID=6984 RepID=A0AAD8EGK6_DIPPU|nr:hypothetical protein L9F63_017860 [Diploptera punctata]
MGAGLYHHTKHPCYLGNMNNWLLFSFLICHTVIATHPKNNDFEDCSNPLINGSMDCKMPCFTPGKLDEALQLASEYSICITKNFNNNLKLAVQSIVNNGDDVIIIGLKENSRQYNETLDNFIKDLKRISNYTTAHQKECYKKAIKSGEREINSMLSDFYSCVDNIMDKFHEEVDRSVEEIQSAASVSSQFRKNMFRCLEDTPNEMQGVLCSYEIMSQIPRILTDPKPFFPEVDSIAASAKEEIKHIKKCSKSVFICGTRLKR